MNYAEIGLEEHEFYYYGIVGFYSRRTRMWYHHPNSSRPAIVHIADEPGNTGQLGQWVFRTDDLNVTTSTAITGTPTGGQLQQPRYSTLLCGKLTYECHALWFMHYNLKALFSTVIASRSLAINIHTSSIHACTSLHDIANNFIVHADCYTSYTHKAYTNSTQFLCECLSTLHMHLHTTQPHSM